jgi:hypothetical protein
MVITASTERSFSSAVDLEEDVAVAVAVAVDTGGTAAAGNVNTRRIRGCNDIMYKG